MPEITTDKPIGRLAAESHEIAVSKGFYELPEREHMDKALGLMLALTDIMGLLTALRKDVAPPPAVWPNRELDDADLYRSLKLLLIASEVAEAFEELLAGNHEKEGFELADIAIRLFDYAAHQGHDLDALIAEKMAKNAERPRKHGARF